MARPHKNHKKQKNKKKSSDNHQQQKPTRITTKKQRLNIDKTLYGLHAVVAAWQNPKRECKNLYVTEQGLTLLRSALKDSQISGLNRPNPIICQRDKLNELTGNDAIHQGIVLETSPLPYTDLATFLTTKSLKENELIILLDQVTDPHNIGAVMRSASAFGASAVILQARHSPPITAIMAKTACGAVEHIPLIREVNLARSLEELKQAGFWNIGLSEHSKTTLANCNTKGRITLALGSEGKGLRPAIIKACDYLVKLPTGAISGGNLESLNISNAAAIALYECRRQRTEDI